jgi:hypothetical protein
MSDEVHYLDEYLTEILPQLGLDVETYGPYVTGYANEDEDTDDGMDDLIELLRASSESHGDDDASWTKFRNDIKRIRKEFLDGEDNRKVSSYSTRIIDCCYIDAKKNAHWFVCGICHVTMQ